MTGRVRYRKEVGPDDVGQRVSLRWVDLQGGHRDKVGRLLAFDDEVALVVDRTEALHIIPTEHLIASKRVPAHPRLPPESSTAGTKQHPIARHAARMLVFDGDRVALVAHHPRKDRRVWTAPGGGIDEGEAPQAAAVREVAEELGWKVGAGPLVLERTAVFTFRGVWLAQHERWFVATAAEDSSTAATPSASEPTPVASDATTDAVRWWSVDELDATDERLAPPELAGLVRRIIDEGPPDEPVVLPERWQQG